MHFVHVRHFVIPHRMELFWPAELAKASPVGACELRRHRAG